MTKRLVWQVAWNTLTGWAALVANGLLTLALVPYLIRALGKEAYGLVGMVSSLVALCTLLDVGFRKGISRQLAAADAHDNAREYVRLVSSSFFLLSALSAGAAAALIVAAEPLARLLGVQPYLVGDAVLGIRVLGAASVVAQFVSPVFVGILTSNNRFDLVNIANPLVSFGRSVLLVIIVVALRGGMRWWIFILAVECVVRLCVMGLLAKRVGRPWRIHPSELSLWSAGSIFSIGGYAFLSQASTMLGSSTDPLVLSRFLGPGAVAVYSPSAQLVSFVNPFVQMLSSQLHPLATRFSEHHETAKLRLLLLRGTRYVGSLGALACVFLFAYSNSICAIWLGAALPGEWPTVAGALRWWTVAAYAGYLESAEWPIVIGTGRVRFFTAVQVPLALANLAASVALVGYARIGLVGVVIPTAVCALVRRPILFWYCNRITQATWADLWRECGVTLLIILGGLGLVAWAMQRLWTPNSWPELALSAALLSVAWVALATFSMKPADKQAVKSILGALPALMARAQ